MLKQKHHLKYTVLHTNRIIYTITLLPSNKNILYVILGETSMLDLYIVFTNLNYTCKRKNNRNVSMIQLGKVTPLHSSFLN